LVALLAAYLRSGRLPPPEQLVPELRQEPVQLPTTRAPFSFLYRGRSCRVRPVAEYRIRGLVVSHNDIDSLADIYHDEGSVDTKDLCVLWGENAASGSYRQVDFSSGPFTCYARWPGEVVFRGDELANNHLITADPGVRRAIDGVRVGDQVAVHGLLVDYQMEGWGKSWRRTSTSRRDSGCEVVFVEDLQVLRHGTPGWYAVRRAAGWLAVAAPAVYLLAFFAEVSLLGTGRIGRL
jgi:hypothetical protein